MLSCYRKITDGYDCNHFSYGFVIVCVIYRYNDRWKVEIRKLTKHMNIFSKWFPAQHKTHPEFISVKSTFGNETHVEAREHGSLYFNMLTKDWASRSPAATRP
ncbi:unnamed protein product [Strongylus vulgaris]|uniref:Uncharacterized protein n=1 Tax=Strongylus vulgaris TaxID=40348 RepID=A0A3P7JVD0_STRVU|nr:unnamed protein product [Strongylus vulgaris]